MRKLNRVFLSVCHPGVTRILHFVRSKNLPFSTSDVKRVVSSCKICAEVKPQFFRSNQNVLIKVTQPMERLSLDFKGPVRSVNSNTYLLIVIDEFSRFPFVFPCKNTLTTTVIQCRDRLFALCGTASFIHTYNASSFSSYEFKQYLLKRRIACSRSSIYHSSGNVQAEKTMGTVWKAIQLALKTCNLPMSHYPNMNKCLLSFHLSINCIIAR